MQTRHVLMGHAAAPAPPMQAKNAQAILFTGITPVTYRKIYSRHAMQTRHVLMEHAKAPALQTVQERFAEAMAVEEAAGHVRADRRAVMDLVFL